MLLRRLSALALALLMAGLAAGQAEDIPKAAPGKGSRSKAAASDKPEKYDDVITKDAKTTPGVFAVH